MNFRPESFDRSLRVSQLLQRELAFLLQGKVNDPAVSGLIVTEVKVNRDLSQAKVYVYSAKQMKPEQVLQGLERCKGFLRHKLATTLKIRIVPELKFFLDETIMFHP